MYIRICKDQDGVLNHTLDISWIAGFSRIDRWKEYCDHVAVNPKWAVGIDFNNTENIIKPEMMTFNDWLKTETSENEINRGNYVAFLTEWLRVFRRDQIFIVNFKALITDTTAVVQNFYKFLNLTSINVTKATLPAPHENHKVKDTVFDCESVNKLYKYFLKQNKGLTKILQSSGKSIYEPDFGEFDDPRNSCASTSI